MSNQLISVVQEGMKSCTLRLRIMRFAGLVICLLGLTLTSSCATSRNMDRYESEESSEQEPDGMQAESDEWVDDIVLEDEAVDLQRENDALLIELAAWQQRDGRLVVEIAELQETLGILQQRNQQLELELAMVLQGGDGLQKASVEEEAGEEVSDAEAEDVPRRRWLRRSRSDTESEPDEQQPTVDASLRRLQVGDEVNVAVFREPEFSGVFRLDADGKIRHPLMGSLTLEGLTIQEVEEKIVSELAARYLVDPRVVVSLDRSGQQRIVVLGEVRRPGVYPFPVGGGKTLLEAVAIAGGFTDLASVDRVRLVRTTNGRSESRRIRVSRLLDGREQDVDLQPNDVITVPEVRF